MDVNEVEGILLEKEKQMDEYIRSERGVVRLCSKSIKEVHKGNLAEAKKLAEEARTKMGELPKLPCRRRHVEQEYAEAIALIAIYEGKEIPGHTGMGVSPEAYLLGLLDCVGEIKRLIVEKLRKGERKEAEAYFVSLEKLYGEVESLHFSSALVPELRRKQDVARMQTEDARSKLIK